MVEPSSASLLEIKVLNTHLSWPRQCLWLYLPQASKVQQDWRQNTSSEMSVDIWALPFSPDELQGNRTRDHVCKSRRMDALRCGFLAAWDCEIFAGSSFSHHQGSPAAAQGCQSFLFLACAIWVTVTTGLWVDMQTTHSVLTLEFGRNTS